MKQDSWSIVVHVLYSMRQFYFDVMDRVRACAYNQTESSCRIAAFVSAGGGLLTMTKLMILHYDSGGSWMYAASPVIQTEIHATLPREPHNTEKYSAHVSQ